MVNIVSTIVRIGAVIAVALIFLVGNNKFYENTFEKYFPSKETKGVDSSIRSSGISTTSIEIIGSIATTTPANQPITPETTSSPSKILPKATTTSKTSLGDVEKNLISAKKIVEQFSFEINQVIPEEKSYTVTEINKITRDALVNIFCTTSSGGSLRPITGTGIIIDERGVILTNSHIAQYFLLRDYPRKDNIICSIRTGSPAVAHYYARPIFISRPWIETNAGNIISQSPMGTGEYDFALLAITDLVNKNETLPTVFPYVQFETRALSEKTAARDSYVAGAYPAGFLGGTAVQKDLYANSAVVSVMGIYTFDKDTIDLISIGGSVVAQKGSSGGGVIRTKDSKLVGIVVTTTDEKETGDRDLRAITTSYINRSLEAQTGKNITQYLAGNIGEKVVSFEKNELPYLKALLTTVLEK